MGRRSVGAGQGLLPGVDAAALQHSRLAPGEQPVVPLRRRRIVALHTGIEGIGELGDDQVIEPLARRQRVAGLGQLGARSAVVMATLASASVM